MEVRNNVQSPNFGMAFRLDKTEKMAAKLKELPMDTIEKLQKAGEILGREGEENATKFYHVKVNDDLSCKIEAGKDAYFGLFKTDKYTTHHGIERDRGVDVVSDRIVLIDDEKGNTFAGVGRYVPYGETEPFFNAWGVIDSYGDINTVDKLAEIAKILDGVAAEKHYASLTQEAAEKAEKAKVSDAVDSLLDSFGV